MPEHQLAVSERSHTGAIALLLIGDLYGGIERSKLAGSLAFLLENAEVQIELGLARTVLAPRIFPWHPRDKVITQCVDDLHAAYGSAGQKQLELLLCYMTGLETCTQRFFPIGQEYGTNSPSTHSLPISPGISGIPITLKTGREQMDSWT